MKSKIKRLAPFLMLALFLAALWSIHRQLAGYRWHDLLSHLRQMPAGQLWWAFLLTLASYLVMTAYDLLALQYIRHPLPYGKAALASFLGYAFSNNVGFSMLAGASIRFRIYTAWGLSAIEITQVVLFCSLSLWLGFLALSGAIFILKPLVLPQSAHLHFLSTRPLGILFLLVLLIYIGSILLSKKAIAIKEWRFSLPSWPLAAGQLLVAATDWLLAGMVLYVLLPQSGSVSVAYFLAIFMTAQLGGLISQVPGGLGVFESIVLLLMPPPVPAPQILGALIAYRGVYYLLPFLIAIMMLGLEEVWRRKALLVQARGVAARVWMGLFVPMLSLAVFLTGAILLFSGALPAVSERLLFLNKAIPLPLLEFSHFMGSLAGMGLLLLARGLQRRLDAAYVLTLILLVVGMAASLLKGLDYEEASFLAIVFLVLLPSRPLFFRRASLFSERFSAGWIATIATMTFAALWLGFFAFRHVEYQQDLWWHFSLKGDAPRFMRASVGAVCLILVFAVARLLRPAPPAPHVPNQEEMQTVQHLVRQSPNASAHLALLGDKRFFFNSTRTAFIMYGVSGQSWVCMGDPIGPEAEWPELLWQFHRDVRRYADRAVFYEVSHRHLHLYLDMGLAALKLGEEARVPLTDFSLEGSGRKDLRYIQRKLTKQGCTFEMLPTEATGDHLAVLKRISDVWLEEKHTREKGFSLGFFDEHYLRQTPVAIVRLNGEPTAFANVWQGADKEELTVDLMRHLPQAPNSVMEYLFIEMMLWGHAQGYRWFNLGMAPLSGMQTREAAPLWHKLGHWVARYGGHFYNFQGLRQYKQKFDPVWTPKYLACPGGLVLPGILADIGALVSGGLKGVLFK
ncbi:MAG: bifunctional lysylphosphatidylglycerol flippase/synthetase MprF [Desulfobacteraceae bacterium]|nr:bifunctional lysylphosphatidylglycerol flippase/synthetase MprF [Desulfobacteraceae bacterium]